MIEKIIRFQELLSLRSTITNGVNYMYPVLTELQNTFEETQVDPFTRIYGNYIQPFGSGILFLLIAIASTIMFASLICSKNPYKEQLKLLRKLFFFVFLNSFLRTIQYLVLILLCPFEGKDQRKWCGDLNIIGFFFINLDKLSMCIDFWASFASFATYLSLIFFWVEHYVLLKRGPALKRGKQKVSFSKFQLVVQIIFWLILSLVVIFCIFVSMIFIIAPLKFSGLEYQITRLIYRVILSMICAIGILYFGFKISLIFTGHFKFPLIKLAVITAVCSTSYLILSAWNIISFIIYIIFKVERNNFISSLLIAIFSFIELFSNALLIFSLTPDSLFCCCRRKKDIDDAGLRQAFEVQSDSDFSDDLQEELMQNHEEDTDSL